jgi:outer membrane protein/protease secretion system outer membrane protein
MKPAALAACLAALCWLPQARAQDSLLPIYQDALFSDPTWRAAQAEAAAGREAVPQALARLLPNVAISASKGKNSTSQESRSVFGGKTTNDYDYGSANYALTLRQAIYRPQEGAALGEAGFRAEAAEARLADALQGLAQRVGETYFAALSAEGELAANQAQQAAYEAQRRQAEKSFAAGYGTRTDIDEAEARLALARAEGLELAHRQGLALQQLAALAGRPVQAIASIEPGKLPLPAPLPGELSAWQAKAAAKSPRLLALAAQEAAAQKAVEKAGAGHKPTLDFIAQRAKSESDSNTSIGSRYDTRMVGLQLSIPVFSGGYVSSTVRQAAAELGRQAQLLEAGRRQVRLEVQAAFDGVRQGAKWVAAYAVAVRSAERLLHSTKKGFEAGTRSNQDILDAAQALAQARRDLARGRGQYLLSRLRLLALAGELDGQAMAVFDSWLSHPGPAASGRLAP